MLYSENYSNKLHNHKSVEFKVKCFLYPFFLSSYLPQAAFFLHVFLDIVPNTTLGEEAAPSDLFELLIAAIFLQGKLHYVHCLREI